MNKEELSKLRMNIQLFAEEADNADNESDATDAGSDDNENITFTDGDEFRSIISVLQSRLQCLIIYF